MSEELQKILVIDDEIQIRKLLKLTLTAAGFQTLEAHDAREGLHFASSARPAVIVLDLGLPDQSGLLTLRQIREWSDVPVLILSVENSAETIIGALNSGADDYLTKPFNSGELIARINVLLRRAIKSRNETPIFEHKHLRVDAEKRLVFVQDVEVKLTATEYDLLALFIRHVGKVLTQQQILKEIWGPNNLAQAQYPRVYVRYLRQKIEIDPHHPTLILTEPGIGYRFR